MSVDFVCFAITWLCMTVGIIGYEGPGYEGPGYEGPGYGCADMYMGCGCHATVRKEGMGKRIMPGEWSKYNGGKLRGVQFYLSG